MMKLTLGVVGIWSLARVVAGQEECASLTTNFPDCALPCVTSAAAEVGCDETDLACRCIPSNSEAIQATAGLCVLNGCNADFDLVNSAIAAGGSVCKCVADATSAPTDSPTDISTPDPTPTSTDYGDDDGDDETETETSHVTTAPPTTTKPDDKPTSSCDTEFPCQKSVDAVPDCASSCINSAAAAAAALRGAAITA